MPTAVVQLQPGDNADKFILGLGSNNPVQDKPVLVPHHVVKNFISLIAKDDLPDECRLPRGEAFTKDGVPPEVAAFCKGKDDDVYHLLRLCGASAITKGGTPINAKIGEAGLSDLEQENVDASVWAICGKNFSPELHEIAISKKSDLKKKFPPKNRGNGWMDTSKGELPSVLVLAVEDDNLEKLATQVENLTVERNLIVEGSLKKAEAAEKLNDPIPRIIDTKPADDLASNFGSVALKDSERRMSATLLFYGQVDFKTNEIKAPVLNDDGIDIYNTDNKRVANGLFQATLLTKEEELTEKSMDFGHRYVDMAQWGPVQVASPAQADFRATRLVSMEDAKERSGYCLAWNLPTQHGAGLARHRLDAERSAQDILGESEENKTRLSTAIRCETRIRDLQSLATCLANTQCLVLVVCKVDAADRGPVIYWAARVLLVEITTLPFRRRYDTSPEMEQVKMRYYVFTTLEQVMVLMAQMSLRLSNIRAVYGGDFAAVNPNEALRAVSIVQESRKKIGQWIDGDIAPSTTLFANSKEKKEHEAKLEADRKADIAAQVAAQVAAAGGRRKTNPALGNTKDNKKQDTLHGAAKRQKSNEGDLLYTGPKERMPTPEGLPKRACGAHYKKGAGCRFGDKCKFDHTPIDDLAPHLQKIWLAHVKATEGLCFNKDRVTFHDVGAAVAASNGDGDKKPAAKK